MIGKTKCKCPRCVRNQVLDELEKWWLDNIDRKGLATKCKECLKLIEEKIKSIR